jgi:medium-chain acyl-[acyl-carrier-protein] hydrolase
LLNDLTCEAPSAPTLQATAAVPAPVLLFCFAHAGASALAFRTWQGLLPPNVTIRPVELPGRGRRIREPLQTDYAALVDLLAAELVDEIAQVQHHHGRVHYAGFGHSAGASFNFAVCARLSERLRQPPLHCFLSAGTPPHLPKKRRSTMSDEALLAEVRALPGAQREVLDDPDLVGFFLPILRADFAAYEASVHDSHRRLDCPFTLFAAARDDIPADEVWAWRRHTAHTARQVIVPGDHFSIVHSPAALIAEIRQEILL